jgi:hypothetical protein
MSTRFNLLERSDLICWTRGSKIERELKVTSGCKSATIVLWKRSFQGVCHAETTENHKQMSYHHHHHRHETEKQEGFNIHFEQTRVLWMQTMHFKNVN